MRQTTVDSNQVLEVAAWLARHPDVTLQDLDRATTRQRIAPRDIAWLVRSGVLDRAEARHLLGVKGRWQVIGTACGKATVTVVRWLVTKALQLWRRYSRPAFDRLRQEE